ncbi:MAG: tRNA adenosine(34) deaminase TadA [Ignavibacteriales bacterium]|nr:tRNA adenosine(34) deaminase TadA [Ignavibacteriales bacterium]
MTIHERWMSHALKEAECAYRAKEVPVGAVVVHQGAIIGRGHNQVETMHDPTAHAEMIALTAAAAHLGSKWLKDCMLYVTMEPCPMCAGAIVLSRIPTLVFGCFDPKMGACGTLYTIPEDKRLNHQVHVIGGVLDAECGMIMKEFFATKRKVKKQ